MSQTTSHEEQNKRKRTDADTASNCNSAPATERFVFVAWHKKSLEDYVDKEIIGIYSTQHAALMAVARLHNKSGRADEDLPEEFFNGEDKTEVQIENALCELHKDKWLSNVYFDGALEDGEHVYSVEPYLLD